LLSGLLRKHAKLRFEPGTPSSYPNVGTLVLGATISTVAGKPRRRMTAHAGRST
jgi:CubicO group peptidase (beta-lactamase class C family)